MFIRKPLQQEQLLERVTVNQELKSQRKDSNDIQLVIHPDGTREAGGVGAAPDVK